MLLLGSLSTLPGCSKALNASEQRGKALYSFNCYECHEENQLGLLKTPPKLHRLFPITTCPMGPHWQPMNLCVKIIIYGRRTMPAFNGRLSNDQVDDIIAYLHRK